MKCKLTLLRIMVKDDLMLNNPKWAKNGKNSVCTVGYTITKFKKDKK